MFEGINNFSSQSYRIIYSWSWKGPLEIIWFTPPSWLGWPGPCPDSFWLSPRRVHYNFSVQMLTVLSHLHSKKFLLMFRWNFFHLYFWAPNVMLWKKLLAGGADSCLCLCYREAWIMTIFWGFFENKVWTFKLFS